MKIGTSLPAVVFRLAASPNAWAKTVAATNHPAVTSSRMLAYQEFYQNVIDELQQSIASPIQRPGSHRMGIPLRQEPRDFCIRLPSPLRVNYGRALHRCGDERNKLIFDNFEKMKIELERSMGEPLSWERLDKRRASRISAVRQNTTIEDAATHDKEIQKWVIDRLLLVKKVFPPRLKSALQAASIAHPTAAPTPEFSEWFRFLTGSRGNSKSRCPAAQAQLIVPRC